MELEIENLKDFIQDKYSVCYTFYTDYYKLIDIINLLIDRYYSSGGVYMDPENKQFILDDIKLQVMKSLDKIDVAGIEILLKSKDFINALTELCFKVYQRQPRVIDNEEYHIGYLYISQNPRYTKEYINYLDQLLNNPLDCDSNLEIEWMGELLIDALENNNGRKLYDMDETAKKLEICLNNLILEQVFNIEDLQDIYSRLQDICNSL